jgi:hypothetical protein
MTTMDKIKVFCFTVTTACVFYILGYVIRSNNEPEPETFGFKDVEHVIDYKLSIQDSTVIIQTWEGYVMKCDITKLEETLIMDNL